MKLEGDRHVQGTSRPEEEKHLEETLAVIHANVDSYGRQVREMRESIDEMLEHYHDDNPELDLLLNNTITLHDHMARALTRNEKALDKPYFGRICFCDPGLMREESLYIGRGGISRDTTHQEVIDWRAPVATTYYENGLGKCSYRSPAGNEIEIDLLLKRTFEIEKGRLLDFYDSEVISNDDLLTKYLARNKQAVLGEIVATIQKEQNEIIRKSPYHNIIVQGVAGSGKTTVAMHRISFILYNYQDRFKPDDFYIVGSNQILLNYITGVLPDLDVNGVRQMTMEQLFVRLLYEDWDGKKYRIRKQADLSREGSHKGSDAWFRSLKEYCDNLEWKLISTQSIYLDPMQFVEGFEDGHTGVFDRSGGRQDPARQILLVDGQAVERYITQNPKVSIQAKINMLNERLTIRIKDEFLGKGVKYTEAERKAILKAYRNWYGDKVWRLSTYDLYEEFLAAQSARGFQIPSPGREFDVYDLAALAYLYKRTKETEVISEAHHMVIDEAQDFGMMVYDCLDFCVGGCTYTIMGDVSQNIHFGFGLNDWEALRRLLLPNPMDSFGILKKSYRNTVEISDFATRILHHGSFVSYPVEPIIRHGDPVEVIQETRGKALWERGARICKNWQEKGLPTIAVVCRSQEEALAAARELSVYLDLGDSLAALEQDMEGAQFENGVMVLPVDYTKGLEFDAVLILDPTREAYPVDDGHARLLYVAATRALHELCVLHTGNLTGLIADPPRDTVSTGKYSQAQHQMKDGDCLAAAPSVEEAGFAVPKATLSHPAKKPSARPKAAIPPVSAPGSPAKPGIHPKARVKVVRTPFSKAAGAETGRSTHPVSSTTHPSQTGHRAASPSMPAFGDMPPTEKLRIPGHPKTDLAVRWVSRQEDGLYLQSRYGILRLAPISGGIVRVTFAKGGKLADTIHPLIQAKKLDRFWTYREAGPAITLSTEELVLQADKATGAICYRTRDKRLLLAERSQECRLAEARPGGNSRCFLFLEPDKKEQLFAISPDSQKSLPLRGGARYISYGKGLPFLFSDQGYGILVASSSPVFSCDLASYGTYLHTEGDAQMDYYFIAGKNIHTLLSACRFLLGKL